MGLKESTLYMGASGRYFGLKFGSFLETGCGGVGSGVNFILFFFSDHFAGLGVSVRFLLFQIELEYQLCRSGNITTDSSGIFYNRVLRSLVFWTDWAGLSGEGGRHRGRLHN